MKQYRTIIFILITVAIAVWMVLPSTSGIFVGSVDKPIQTRLGLDLVGGVQALLEADLPADVNVSAEDMRTARAIVENRVNGLGVEEAVVQQAGDRRIVVELPGETDPEQALATIRQTGILEFVEMGTSPVPIGTEIKTDYGSSGANQPSSTQPTLATTPQATPPATEAAPQSPAPTDENVYHTVLTGSALTNVSVSTTATGQYEIAFQLDSEGGQIFGDYTTNHVGEILGIVLDKKVISTPQINGPITQGSGVITGNFTLDSANALAVQLRYGSLPIPLKVVESRTVGPTLGEDSLRKSLVAGAIGLSVVILFMALYYRLPGVLADLALIVYALITFALFKFIPVTLTLPGIAGFVLSIGVAVDANVLIFERLKEELRSGRTLTQAIDLGWDRAWPSIRDSNFSTLITCSILFWFGSAFGASIVKGFSLTLAIGVLVSMFTAIIVTRTFLHLVLDNVEFVEHAGWFGV